MQLDHPLDRRVRQLGEPVALGVVAHPVRRGRVEHLLRADHRHPPEHVERRWAELAQRPQHALALVGVARVDDPDREGRLALELLGERRLGRNGHERLVDRQVVRRLVHEVARETQGLAGALERMQQHARQHLRPVLAELELELGDDAEVAAAAAQAPEQVRVLLVGRSHDLALRRHDARGTQAVDREAVAAHDPADPAAEREAGDAGVRHVAVGDRQAVRPGRPRNVAEQRAAADARAAGLRVDLDAVHRRQVDGHPAVRHRVALHAVPAAAHGDLHSLVAGAQQRLGDLRVRAGPGDGRRAVVDRAVPEGARRVVALVLRFDHFTAQAVGHAHGSPLLVVQGELARSPSRIRRGGPLFAPWFESRALLLRKPHGFEGLFSPREDLERRRLAVTHRPNVRGSPLDKRGATQRSRTLHEEDDYLAVALEEGLRLDAHRVEWAEEILKGSPRSFHPGNRLDLETSAGGLQLEVAMRHAEDGVPIFAAHGCVLGAERLESFLRHRPRSIPQARTFKNKGPGEPGPLPDGVSD